MALGADRDLPRTSAGRRRAADPCCAQPPHTIIRLTGRHPVRVTAAGGQELRLALDVSDYDEIDIELRVFVLKGTGATLQVTLETGMQCSTDHGWTTLATFPLISSAPAIKLRSLRGLLRYLRWNVTTLGGTTPTATFLIDGVARSWTAPARERQASAHAPAAWRARPSLPELYPTAGAGSGRGGGFGPSGQAPPASPGATTTPSHLGFGAVGDEPPLMTQDDWACLIAACQPPLTCCPQGHLAAVCANLSSNPEHCGQCDNACGPSQLCVQGSCRAFTSAANIGFDAIEFYRKPQQQLLFGKTVTSPASRAWGSSKLNDLPQTPTEDVRARVVSTGAGEVNLFAFDPAEAAQLLQSADWGYGGQGLLSNVALSLAPPGFQDAYSGSQCVDSDTYWDVVTSTGVMPDARAIRPGLAGLPEMTLELSPSSFWPSGVAEGLASEPTGTGSVKAVRLLNHGACSARRPMLQDILQPVADGFWDSLKQRLADNLFADDVLRHFIHVTTYLDGTGGNPRGGFVLDFSISVGVPVLFGSIDLCGTASYELFLDSGDDEGLLRVSPTVHSIAGPIEQAAVIFNALLEELPDEFAKIANSSQVVDVFEAIGSAQCTVNPVTQCQFAVEQVLDFVDAGAAVLGLGGNEAQNLKNALQAQDSTSNTGLRHWHCDGGVCKFIARAKRLNVYPDEIELVWFDGKELDDPAYALYVAAIGLAAQQNIDVIAQLCNAPIDIIQPTGSFRRPFASYALGPAYVDF